MKLKVLIAGNVGDCEQYCFSNLNNAMPAFVNGYNTIAASGQSPGVMVVPGLYEPEETYLPSLVGCPVNGTWTLTVRDNFIFDDGFICEWGIYFSSNRCNVSDTWLKKVKDETSNHHIHIL